MERVNNNVKFRFVILDDYDNVIKVLDESPEFKDRWDPDWNEYEYRMLLELNYRYDFYHYDDCPNIITQIYVDNKWKFHSNTISDWFNL